ncbi:hypothetical protein [Empedobacter sedimenti]|uniref:hypothetical protein n=1 Tax=Empedobacter sedimenti TaxID=3042610 RepID=UPI0024A6AE0A|nr:hypothetical protein [Empedobacter sedimenti]
MNRKKLTKKIETDLLNFIQKVHDVEGVDQQLLNEILADFAQLTVILKKEDSIPKEIAMILVDMVSVLFNDANYYPEDYRSEIYLSADQLSTAAYELCSNENQQT